MGKSRTANRGWRSKMNKHLADNPEKQAQVNAINLQRYTDQLERLTETQSGLVDQIAFVEGEIDRLTATGEPVA